MLSRKYRSKQAERLEMLIKSKQEKIRLQRLGIKQHPEFVERDEAIDPETGRLKPGFRYVKGGGIVRVKKDK